MAGSEVAGEGVVGGIASKFGAVGAAGLVEHVADVARDGCGSDVEGGGDVAIALPGDEDPQHVAFAGREHRLLGPDLSPGWSGRVRVGRVEELFEGERGRFPIIAVERSGGGAVEEAQARVGQHRGGPRRGWAL